jgi:hypothetical protein
VPRDDYHEGLRLLAAGALRRFGSSLTGVTLHFGPATYSQPIVPEPPPLSNGPGAGGLAGWASGPTPRHLSDFQIVYWPGKGRFVFSDKQREAVRLLWQAWEEGLPGVKERTLLEAAGSSGERLYDLFRRSPAWNTLIVKGEGGTFRLADLPEGEDEAEPPENVDGPDED